MKEFLRLQERETVSDAGTNERPAASKRGPVADAGPNKRRAASKRESDADAGRGSVSDAGSPEPNERLERPVVPDLGSPIPTLEEHEDDEVSPTQQQINELFDSDSNEEVSAASATEKPRKEEDRDHSTKYGAASLLHLNLSGASANTTAHTLINTSTASEYEATTIVGSDHEYDKEHATTMDELST